MPRLPPELTPNSSSHGSDVVAHLSLATTIAEIDDLGCGEWTTLYESRTVAEISRCQYSAFLQPALVSGALNRVNWELSIGDGAPGFNVAHSKGVEVAKYYRFSERGAEPILYSRDFHDIKPRQFDLSEEFRLYHNLYHDRYNDKYIYLEKGGNEVAAAEVSPTHTRVFTRLLRQYMAARQLALVLFFDHRAHATGDIKVAEASLPPSRTSRSDRCYSFNVGSMSSDLFSRLVGKKIVLPPAVEKSGIWPYDSGEPEGYASFIIGVNDEGSPVEHSCNPDTLANYFGANENAPNYMTPVWFSRKVLAKYYDDPDKYSVEDGYLRCGSLWGVTIDNNLPDHVVVYLGDLGRDMHHSEQIHWRQHNITPAGEKTSETNFSRSFLAQFSDPTAPDLAFRHLYTQLNELWLSKFGWMIFRSLHKSDAHIMKQFRIPLSESLGEFENQILILVKLMVDALNEGGLTRACGVGLPNEKGISKLKRFLESQNYGSVDRDIRLLTTLQALRSSGVAHMKGSNFDKLQISIGLDRKFSQTVFRDLLSGINEMLVDIMAQVASNAPPQISADGV